MGAHLRPYSWLHLGFRRRHERKATSHAGIDCIRHVMCTAFEAVDPETVSCASKNLAFCIPQERQSLVLRQSGQVESGKRIQVYAADMRRRIALQFWPDGYEWAEAEPITLAEVHSVQHPLRPAAGLNAASVDDLNGFQRSRQVGSVFSRPCQLI